MREINKADLEVVRALCTLVSNFEQSTQEELKKISDVTIEAGDYWKDIKYQQFDAFMQQLLENIRAEIKVLDEAKQALEKELTPVV